MSGGANEKEYKKSISTNVSIMCKYFWLWN